MPKITLRPSPNFDRLIAQAGLTPGQLIEAAGISRSTYFGWRNPAIKNNPRHEGIRPVNAWKLVKVYAQAAGCSDEEAYQRLIVEIT